jgi:hypothetical protein
MRLTVIIEGSERRAQERRPARFATEPLLALRPAAFSKRLFRHGLCRGPLRHPPAFEIGMAAFPFDDFVVLSAHKACLPMLGIHLCIVKCRARGLNGLEWGQVEKIAVSTAIFST